MSHVKKKQPQRETEAVGNRKKHILTTTDGKLRTVWILLIVLVVYYGLNLLSALLLTKTSATVGTFVSAGSAIVLIAVLLLLRRILRIGNGASATVPRIVQWGLTGLLGALFCVALCLISDSLRLERPFARIDLTWNALWYLPLSILSAASWNVLAIGLIYPVFRERMRSVWIARVLTCVVMFFIGNGWNLSVIGMINTAAQILLCCLLSERWGISVGIALWSGWNYALSGIVAYTGGIWTIYHVSEVWMTGGSKGIFCGLPATLFLLGVILILILKQKKSASPTE